MAVTAASIAILAVTALVCARSISPRPMQSNATRASWMAASSSRMASSSTAPRPPPSGIIIGLLPWLPGQQAETLPIAGQTILQLQLPFMPFVGKIEPLAGMDDDDIVAAIAPIIQRY